MEVLHGHALVSFDCLLVESATRLGHIRGVCYVLALVFIVFDVSCHVGGLVGSFVLVLDISSTNPDDVRAGVSAALVGQLLRGVRHSWIKTLSAASVILL